MTIIISIIIIVALVSLYDYFSAKNWQQVTSDVRNDVVFEKRNKAYGAYVIRRDYNKRMILIMAGLIGSMGATYGAYRFAGGDPEMKLAVAIPSTDDDFDTTVLTLIHDVEVPDLKTEETESVQKTEANPAPVADDGATMPLPPIPTGTNPISNKPQDGTGTSVRPPLPEPPVAVPPVVPTGPFVDVDEAAEFPGGKREMVEFLMKNLKYPEVALENGIGGKCYLRFVVDKDGEISSIRVTRGLDDCPECEREAMRVIGKMPKWRPGKVNGKAVDSYFDMPINFVVE